MALEIERKWLVSDANIPDTTGLPVLNIEQVYALDKDGVTLRVRSEINREHGSAEGYVTVKSPSSCGVSHELEMRIPYDTASTLISSCSRKIVKTRTLIPWDGLMIELDVFYNNETNLPCLIMAEVEFLEKGMPFDEPYWFGREVTGVPGYSNAAMIKRGLPRDFLDDPVYNTFSNYEGYRGKNK